MKFLHKINATGQRLRSPKPPQNTPDPTPPPTATDYPSNRPNSYAARNGAARNGAASNGGLSPDPRQALAMAMHGGGKPPEPSGAPVNGGTSNGHHGTRTNAYNSAPNSAPNAHNSAPNSGEAKKSGLSLSGMLHGLKGSEEKKEERRPREETANKVRITWVPI